MTASTLPKMTVAAIAVAGIKVLIREDYRSAWLRFVSISGAAERRRTCHTYVNDGKEPATALPAAGGLAAGRLRRPNLDAAAHASRVGDVILISPRLDRGGRRIE